MNTKNISHKTHNQNRLIQEYAMKIGSSPKRGILMIPDISGFTEFVIRSDLETGRYIIQKLLGSIIRSNQLNLLISEIEGDAVLFYKFDRLPNFSDLKMQAEVIYRNFKQELDCLVQELKVQIPLSLKIIIHYGIFSTYRIGRFHKLYGAPVVEAHKMLKTFISDKPPFALFSEAFAAEYEELHVDKIPNKTELIRVSLIPNIAFLCYLERDTKYES